MTATYRPWHMDPDTQADLIWEAWQESGTELSFDHWCEEQYDHEADQEIRSRA